MQRDDNVAGRSRRQFDRVRLNVIIHLLSQVPYETAPTTKVVFPKRKIGRYRPVDHLFRYVPERF